MSTYIHTQVLTVLKIVKQAHIHIQVCSHSQTYTHIVRRASLVQAPTRP